MHEEALKFLSSQRVGVIAIEMMDGSPHASTVHVAHTDEPVILFETDKRYRKAEPLFGRPVSRASMAIGFEEGAKSRTLQMDGEASLVDASDPRIESVYLKKFPEKIEKAKGENVIWFQFKPTWWRFTDWGAPEGKTVYLSDGSVTVKK